MVKTETYVTVLCCFNVAVKTETFIIVLCCFNVVVKTETFVIVLCCFNVVVKTETFVIVLCCFSVVVWDVGRKEPLRGLQAQKKSSGMTFVIAFANQTDDMFVTGGE